MIIGPYINALAIISGAVIGSLLGGRIPERLRTNYLWSVFYGHGHCDGSENDKYACNDFIGVIGYDYW